ncbi:hypothetical protein BpHYR1_020972 [Brachionus plicatilis]|uniref:SWIM-type domain-containing protein n=1 Tax=Brachionus plicatilis TaxID=10195 RepID=A0A3M7QPW8_BRAPC|nr:hypothetical protein BpHYR1_020972 [Brachionus plicatilis]
MPRRKIDWIFLTKLNSEVDLEHFFKQYPKQSSGHANSNNCTICSDNSDCHKMVVLYPKCKCQKNCITRYLVTKCQKKGQIVIKGVNMHPILNLTEIQTQALKNKHGISVNRCNWQLFQTPPGYAMSNNPIESYNNKIKRFFTERTKFNLLPVFEIFEKVVTFESRIDYITPICSFAKLSTKREAKKHLESIAKLEEEKEIDDILLKYKWSDKYFVEINPNCFCPDCTHCSCCQFLDSAVCIHLVGCCYLDSIGFPGIILKKFKNKNSSQKRIVGPWYEKD